MVRSRPSFRREPFGSRRWQSFARISRAIPEPPQRDPPSVAAASKLSATPFMQ
jgi:hypothetical protein